MSIPDTILIRSAVHDLYFRFKCIYCECEFLRNTKSDDVHDGYYMDKPLLWGDREEVVETKPGVITTCPTCGAIIGTEHKPERYDINGFQN